MNRPLTIYACAVLAFSLTACSGTATEHQQPSNSVNATTTEQRSQASEQAPVAVVEEATQLPSYQEMTESVDSLIGTKYAVSGRVTNVSGGFRGDDYMVYVYWDELETFGEVAAVRIPYKSYTQSVNKHFEGDCRLEGLDEDGHPQFVCQSYSAE